MDSKLRITITLLIWSLVLGAGLLGLFRPLDDSLRDLRFAAEMRAPTGNIVFADIDARSVPSRRRFDAVAPILSDFCPALARTEWHINRWCGCP